MTDGAACYPEAVKFLDALLEGIPESQYREIRTLKKSGGAKKKFYSLSKLRQQGFEAALPGELDGLDGYLYGLCRDAAARPAAMTPASGAMWKLLAAA